MLNTFEKCCIIRRMISTRAGEVMDYDWSAEFAKKNIKGFPDDLNTEGDNFYHIQPSELTNDEMNKLEFGKWSKKDPIRLIPLWLYPFLADKIKTKCINGKEYTKKSDIDNDHRCGCLAYGVIPKDEKGHLHGKKHEAPKP